MNKKFLEFLESKGLTEETFKEKSAEEMAEIYNEYNAESRQAIEEAIESKASNEDLDALKDAFEKVKDAQMEFLNTKLKEMGVQLKKFTDEENAGRKKSFAENLEAGLRDNLENLQTLKTSKQGEFSFKVAGDMTISGNVSGGNVPVEQRIPGLDRLASRRITLLDLVTRGTATSNVISWVSQANQDGSAGGTAEGASKNQIDFDLVVDSEEVVKRTAYIKVSTEMLDDIDFINTEIRTELMQELLKDVENQVYQGDGVAPNMNGIRTVATAFAAGSFAGTVDNANKVDVLRAAISQVEEANGEPPTAILMRPADLTALKFEKVTTTDKRYIDALQEIAREKSLDGVPIVTTTMVTLDDYLVGHFPFATVYDKGEIMIQVGLDGNDFTENKRTILAEWRGATVVKTNKRISFVKGDFTTDAAALETP